MIYNVLSIDAWGNQDHGYEWNDWHTVNQYDAATRGPLTHISAMQYFEDEYLNENHSCEIQDDGYNFVLVHKPTDKPLYCIEYGDGL